MRAMYEYLHHDELNNMNEHELECFQEITEQLVECVMDNRHLGYWHIGQVFNKMAKFAATRVPTDDMQLTQGQLLQVNFAPVWHGRTIGEAQNTIDTICLVQREDPPESAAEFRARHIRKIQDDVAWLTEMRSHSVVFFDLALNLLEDEHEHQRVGFEHFIRRLIHVLATRELRGENGALEDEVQQIGHHAAAHAALHMHAGAAIVLPIDDSGVKRFKKADTSQQSEQHSAVVLEQASSVAPSLQTEVEPAAAADTLVSGWDFVKDIEQIFAAETSPAGSAVSSLSTTLKLAAGRRKKQAEDPV